MNAWLRAFALCTLATGTALAQPQPPQPPQPPGPEPQPPPQPPPPEPPRTRPQPALQPAVLDPPADEGRPSDLSIAIGLGYALPTSLQTPNITSVRLRLPSGLTIEPQLVLASSSTEVDTGVSMKDESSEIGIAGLVRLPMVKHGRVDLELCAGLTLNRAATKPENDMDVTVSTFGLVYGIAVTSWITRHWQVSLTGLNSLITSTKRDAENPVGNTVTTNTTFGLIFDPTIALMVHLYH